MVKNIRRQTREQYSAEGKIRIVLEGLRGENIIAQKANNPEKSAPKRTLSLKLECIFTTSS
ncbi:MAG: hypothetical protein K9G33_06145 [Sneathiella sp.]|nr:hypothetical protein [Sneathiella sp.]